MADFTLLRFQECSDAFIGHIRRSGQWILLWTAAVFSLFYNLGTMSVSGSEGRWLAVAQSMLRTGDWLHPAINGVPYFDKPLVSYWLICLCSLFTDGVSEFSARLPSALAALLLLGSVISISRTLFSGRAALIAGWLTLSLYSFIFWGRLAEADMENAAFIAAAAAWYLKCRDRQSLPAYAVFWILCGIGAQTKGLAAIVIPACAAGIDMILRKKILFHLNWKSLTGFLIGSLVFALPFVLESIFRKSYDASGILLVVRENIIRAVDPWDHNDEPFWCYFIHVPRLLIPWTPFFLLALADALRRLFRTPRAMTADEKWILFTTCMIFLLFTLSRSRRVYYILPIMPFAMILTGNFLAGRSEDPEGFLAGLLFRIADVLLPVCAFLALGAPLYLRIAAPYFLPEQTPVPILFAAFFYFIIPFFGILLLLFYALMRIWMKRGRKLPEILPDRPAADRVIFMTVLLMFFLFGVFLPYLKSAPEFRPQKEFFRRAGKVLFEENRIPPGNVAFFGTDLSYGVYDLNLPEYADIYGWKEVNRADITFRDDVLVTKGPDEFRAFLSKIEKEGGAVFLRFRSMDNPERPEDITRRFVPDPGRSLNPSPQVRIEDDSILDLKLREDAEHALASGADPAKSKAVRAYRKALGKKTMYLVYPAPEARDR